MVKAGIQTSFLLIGIGRKKDHQEWMHRTTDQLLSSEEGWVEDKEKKEKINKRRKQSRASRTSSLDAAPYNLDLACEKIFCDFLGMHWTVLSRIVRYYSKDTEMLNESHRQAGVFYSAAQQAPSPTVAAQGTLSQLQAPRLLFSWDSLISQMNGELGLD